MDGGGPGEAGAVDRDGVATGLGTVVRADAGDCRRTVIGVLVSGELTAEVPLGVVTVTSTVPVPEGTVTVRLAEVTLVTPVPSGGAEVHGGAPVKPVPVTVTVLPPAGAPLFGLTPGDRRRRVVGERVGGRVDR